MQNRLIVLVIAAIMSFGSVFVSNDSTKYFECTQSATAPSVSMARQKALLHAKNLLATMVNGKVKNVSESYISNNSLTGETADEFMTETKTTASILLKGAEVADESVVMEKKNRYTVYVTLKLDKKKILDSLCKNISENKSLSNGFDKGKFTEEWNRNK